MRHYDRGAPLIFIHVPKTAGASVRRVFKSWFGDALFFHYSNPSTDALPKKIDIRALHSVDRPVAVYGHFNRLRGFGIEEYYPEVRQFVTILRDPFDTAISSYYYIRKVGDSWKDRSRVPTSDLRSFLASTPPNILNHFPRMVTRDNYRALIEEFFVSVGIMEHLSESVRQMADRLGMPFNAEEIPHVNATARDQPYPADLRDEYAERHRLEFDVYHYAASRLPVPVAAVDRD